MKELIDILKMTQSELHNYVTQELDNLGIRYIQKFGSYIMSQKIKGPLCFVAHMDTVGLRPPTDIKMKDGRISLNKKDQKDGLVLGGDDRCGVYLILKILKEYKNSSFIFTWNEEVGGVGVKTLINDFDRDHFKKVKLFIELDRKGNMEYVVYSNDSDKVNSWCESFGLRKSFGSYSDVYDITKAYKIPHINVGCGYYHAHTRNEYIVYEHVEKTFSVIIKMINNPIKRRYYVKNRYINLYDISIKELMKKYKLY